MFQRKITDSLLAWSKRHKRFPILLKGSRGVGKTEAVLEFCKSQYPNVLYFDMNSNESLRDIFKGDMDIDRIVDALSYYAKGQPIIPGKTVLIFDEIKDCPNVRTSFKYFSLDRRYDVIAISSFSGLGAYDKNNQGFVSDYQKEMTMHPMDFEEFLWASSINPRQTENLRLCMQNEEPVPEYLHQEMLRLYRMYMLVGGMPEAVETFIQTRDLDSVLAYQNKVLDQLRSGFGYKLLKDGKPKLNPSFQLATTSVFDSIDANLSKTYGKFGFKQFEFDNRTVHEAVTWLLDSMAINVSYNLQSLEIPLEDQKLPKLFKLYFQDIGLFSSTLNELHRQAVSRGDTYHSGVSIFDHVVSDAFSKSGKNLYYFRRPTGLEIDFVAEYQGKTTLIQSKPRNGNYKSLRTILEDGKYQVDSAIRIGEKNLARNGKILDIPYYLVPFLAC